MKPPGTGLSDLTAAGVAKVSEFEDCDAFDPGGLIAPTGNDFENSGLRCNPFICRGACSISTGTLVSSVRLDPEDDGTRVLERGWG